MSSRPRSKSQDRPAGGTAGRVIPEGPAPGLFGRFPNGAALVVLALLLLAFFSPMIFGGRVFLPPDSVAPRSNRPYLEEVRKGGEYPLWTPYLFSGMPSLGSLIAAPNTNPFSTVLNPLGPNLKQVSYYFLMGLFTFLLARRRKMHTFAAFFAALAFVFGAQVIGWIMAGHTSKMATAVFMPLTLLLVDWLFERPGPLPASLLALSIGLSVVSSHMQVTYYTLLAAGLYMLVLTLTRLKDRQNVGGLGAAWGFFLVAAAVGAGASAILSLPVREYAPFSIRGGVGTPGLGRDYATNWSFHPLESLAFFIPSFFGFGGQTYWGWMPFTDAPQYMGILPLFLAVVGVTLRRKERFTQFLVLLAVLAWVVSFGKELPILFDPMFKFLPGFNKFRVPSMILVLTSLAVALLAALGLDALLQPAPEAERQRRVASYRRVMYAFGGVLLMLGLLALIGRGVIGARALKQLGAGGAAEAFARAGRDVPLVCVVFGVGAGVLLAWLERRMSRTVALGLVTVLTVADLWVVGLQTAHYQTPADDSNLFKPTPTVEFLKKDTGLFRILPLSAPLAPSPNWWAYFKLQNAFGYHPAKLKVYQDLIDDQGPVGISKALSQGNFNLIRLLNVKYLILNQNGLQIPGLTLVNAVQVTSANSGGGEYTYRVEETLPRAFFVETVRVLPDPRQVLTAMADPAWRPDREALLLEDPGAALQPATGSTAVITDYRPHHLKATLNATGNNLLVLSEVYFPPGWHARLDGQPVPILRADYAFRGVMVPAGPHTLEMNFSDPAFERGKSISMASYGVILCGVLAGLVLDRRRRGGSAAPPAAAPDRAAADPPPAGRQG